MKQQTLLISFFALGGLSNMSNAQTVTDMDGNVYNTVTIGTQVWMKENLKTTNYNDGTAIPLVTDGGTWSAIPTPAYCWYNNDAATYKNPYGALYNWYTVNTGKLCPTGWHVPSDAEWTTLENYVGGAATAAGYLKEAGTSHWAAPNQGPTANGATDSYGFTALPGGRIGASGFGYDFSQIGTDANFYSSAENSNGYSGTGYDMNNAYADIVINTYSRNYGYSVRCISGAAAGIKENTDSYSFALYPNPVSNELHIEIFSSHTKQKVEILNMMGQIIYNSVMEEKSVVDVSCFPSGMYLVRMTSDDNSTVMLKRFIK